MSALLDTAIIGAGPYGLSLAAHLRARNASFRIFGHPLDTWRRHMPKGMMLKSDGFASSLSCSEDGYQVGDYCRHNNLPYDDTAIPVSLETFTDYGADFQQTLVPSLDRKTIAALSGEADGFALCADDGEVLRARNVVLAVGLSYFDHAPAALRGLPASLVSHSACHHDLEAFRGRDVIVVGAGASAVDIAVLLHEHGAGVRLVARGPSVKFFSEPGSGKPSMWRRLRHPSSGLGPGLRSRFYAEAPGWFRRLPAPARRWIVGRHLGPASPWRLKHRLLDNVEVLANHKLTFARACGNGVQLVFETPTTPAATLHCDHVIAATGYKVDVERIRFIESALRQRIPTRFGAPVISGRFESIRGLYFIGPAVANTFGPVMRFIYGSDFSARRLSEHLINHSSGRL